jgi:hypothetical protein
MADRNTKIRGSQIRDLSITNDDISNSAGIQESKLSLNYPTHSNATDHASGSDNQVADTVPTEDSGVSVQDALNTLEGSSHAPAVLGTKTVDESGISDGYVLYWDATAGKLMYHEDILPAAAQIYPVGYELANGTPNGVLVDFTHDDAAIEASVQVFLNGILQQPGSGSDYTYNVATKKATFAIAPDTGDLVAFSYIKS